MLERLGIESVKVVEVVSMDEMLLRHEYAPYTNTCHYLFLL